MRVLSRLLHSPRALLYIGTGLTVGAALSGCGGPQNFMYAGGPAARGLASLGWWGLLVFAAVTAVVWILIFALALRRRGTLSEHAPIDVNRGQSWIVIGGFAIPVAILAILFISTLETLAAYPLDHGAHGGGGPRPQPDIRIIGHQWWFDAQYVSHETPTRINTTTEIHIPVGRPMDLSLETRDVIHSFWIPKLHGKVDLIPGQVNHVRIAADTPGVYEGECAEYCGLQHAHMRLQVVAQTPEEFDRWLAAQGALASQPTTPESMRGYEVFQSAACPLCHTIRGTPAQGSVGPELTHVGSRRRIAGGAFVNNTANLEAWITHAQSLKPGAQMPDLTQFRGEDLRAMVAYLQSLK